MKTLDFDRARRRRRERLKSLYVFLLLLTALCFSLLIFVFDSTTISAHGSAWDSIASLLGFGPRALPVYDPGTLLSGEEAASPVRVAVMATERRGAQYDPKTVDAFFTEFRPVLRQTLDAARPPKPSTRAAFFQALKNTGVYCEYLFPVPYSLLCRWWDATAAPGLEMDMDVRFVYLTEEGGYRTLFFADSTLDTVQRFTTSLPFTLPDATGLLPFRFWGDTAGFDGMKAMTMVFDAPPAPPVVQHKPLPLNAIDLSAFLRLLGLNPDTFVRYLKNDGTIVYVDEPRSASFSPTGVLHFTCADPSQVLQTDTAKQRAERVEQARLLWQTLASHWGDSRLIFSGYNFDPETGRAVVTFDETVWGASVRHGDAHAATVVFAGDEIVEVSATLHTHRLTEETDVLLSETMAMLLVHDDLRLVLSYVDTGGEALHSTWTAE